MNVIRFFHCDPIETPHFKLEQIEIGVIDWKSIFLRFTPRGSTKNQVRRKAVEKKII